MLITPPPPLWHSTCSLASLASEHRRQPMQSLQDSCHERNLQRKWAGGKMHAIQRKQSGRGLSFPFALPASSPLFLCPWGAYNTAEDGSGGECGRRCRAAIAATTALAMAIPALAVPRRAISVPTPHTRACGRTPLVQLLLAHPPFVSGEQQLLRAAGSPRTRAPQRQGAGRRVPRGRAAWCRRATRSPRPSRGTGTARCGAP